MTPRKTFLDYDARRTPKTSCYCCKCQRDLDPEKAFRWVRLVDGGHMVLHPDDEGAYVPDGGDTGWHRIGMECAAELGLQWTTIQPTSLTR